jgi:hypothetical protein
MSELMTRPAAEAIEGVVVQGDLSKLSPEQRVVYYRNVCNSLGLNYLTRPFDYITLNGKLTLYARKDATDQLRRAYGISIGAPDIKFQDDWIIVTISAHDKSGREDSDIGVVNKKDMRGDFGNAVMKAVTKAKRRVTLSICGLGWSDETEVETIPDAKPVVVDIETGEIEQTATKPEPAPKDTGWMKDAKARSGFWAWCTEQGLSHGEVHEALKVESLNDYAGDKKDARDAITAFIATKSQPVQEAAQ